MSLKKPLMLLASVGLAATIIRWTVERIELNPLELHCDRRGLIVYDSATTSPDLQRILLRINVETLIYNFFYNPEFASYSAIRIISQTSLRSEPLITREDNAERVIAELFKAISSTDYVMVSLLRDTNNAVILNGNNFYGLSTYFPNEIAEEISDQVNIVASQTYYYRNGRLEGQAYIILPMNGRNLIISDPMIVDRAQEYVVLRDEQGNILTLYGDAADYIVNQLPALNPRYGNNPNCFIEG